MTVAEMHSAAGARRYGPPAPDLRNDLHAGLTRAVAMLDAVQAPDDVDALTLQLIGLQRKRIPKVL